MIEIYVHDDSKDYEYEFGVQKGYWDNIYVKKREKVFRLNVITLDRLIQDCKVSLEWAGCYISDPNLVIVEKATKSIIIKTLMKQEEMGFYDNLVNCCYNGEILFVESEEHWKTKEQKTFSLNNLKKIL